MDAVASPVAQTQQTPSFLSRLALPALAGVMAVGMILTAVVFLAASQANQLAADRQQQLAATVVRQSLAGVAHDQEAVTVWDDAVRNVRATHLDMQWLDDNLGVWLYGYYGHDEAVILDSADHPIYAMKDGRRATLTAYDRELKPATGALIRQLRAKLRGRARDVGTTARSPGVADLGIVNGQPAIVSIKPIISDSGALPQPPGGEFLHISVRRLGAKFAGELAGEYQLDGASFTRAPPRQGNRRATPLVNDAGKTLGYISWKPFGPGAIMIQRIAPFAIGSLLLILAMVAWLLQRIRRSTLALHASQAQSQHLAYHDSLTGLANRALFDERLARALAEAQQGRQMIALLYFDLDRFKHVNDTLGHPAGDELICGMARRLAHATRSTDVVARIGGDEFAIIQTGVASASEAEVLCMRVVEAVSEPFTLGGSKVHVGVSIGVALAPADANDRTELARKADIALYEAKASGRGCYVFFAEEMDASIRHRRETERDLRAALAGGGEFDVVYQPTFSAQSGKLTGAEALVRWDHPRKGRMSPVSFIPVAEATGLIEPLGEWVLEEACRAAVRLPLERISVNVSAVQLRNDKFAERVLSILARTGLDPSRLELEITETSFIESAANCRPSLAVLRAKGVQIALDDFGTGYSSFSHLRHFDIDRIKIDQSFVNGIDIRDGGSAIIKAIVDLAKASGMQVTAEGVETAEQSRFLSKVGCNSLQGYLLSRPVALAELGRMLVSPDGGAAPAATQVRKVSPTAKAPQRASEVAAPATG